MLDSKYKVIMFKTDWCGFCIQFLPIYIQTIKSLLKSKSDKLKNIKFESYDDNGKFKEYDGTDNDMDNTNNKIISDKYYEKLKEKVKGYPTIFIVCEEDQEKIITINSVLVNNELNDDKQIPEAVKRFIKNIIIGIKNLESNGKSEFVQVGGNKNYESKYQKYKSKYIELKKLLNK